MAKSAACSPSCPANACTSHIVLIAPKIFLKGGRHELARLWANNDWLKPHQTDQQEIAVLLVG